MGDSLAPIADDAATGLMYNPAALAGLTGLGFEPLNFQGQVNQNFFDTYDATNSHNVFNLGKYKKTLQSNQWAFPGAGWGIFPNFHLGRFIAVGYLWQRIVQAQAKHGEIRYKVRDEIVPSIGTGIRLARGIVRFGYVLQWVNKSVGDVSVADTASLDYGNQLKQGHALSHNAAFQLTLPFHFKPALAIVLRNIGNTRYVGGGLSKFASNSPSAPESERMSLDASLSVESRIQSGLGYAFVLNARDATGSSGMPILVRGAIGAEFNFSNFFYIRGGFSSGYPTAGLGIRRDYVDFNLAWYSEEIGSGYHSERDIRFILHYKIHF